MPVEGPGGQGGAATVTEAGGARPTEGVQAPGAEPGRTAAATLGTTLEVRVADGATPDALLQGLAAGPVPSSPEGAAVAAQANEAGVPPLAEGQIMHGDVDVDVDAAAQTELGTDHTGPDSPAATPQPDATEPRAPGNPDAAGDGPTPVTNAVGEAGQSPADAQSDQSDVQPGDEGKSNNEQQGVSEAEQKRQQELKDLAEKINLGAHLSRLGVPEGIAKQLLEQIVDSDNPQGMIESLNGILREIPSPGENSGEATQTAQQQENAILDQVGKLEQQAKEGKLDDEGKQKLGVLKRILVFLKLIGIAFLVGATGKVSASMAAAVGVKG